MTQEEIAKIKSEIELLTSRLMHIDEMKINYMIKEIEIIQRRMIELIYKDELCASEFLEIKQKYDQYITFIYILQIYFDYKFETIYAHQIRMIENYITSTQRKLEEIWNSNRWTG